MDLLDLIKEEHRIVSAALEALPAALVANLPLSNSLNINSNEFQQEQEQRLQINLLSMTPSPPLTIPSNAQWLGGTINGAGGGLSLEHLVKIVVATVREVTGSGQQKKSKSEENDKQKEEEHQQNTKGKTANIVEESAELILERRRQQNNAAAARYRKRQRQVESGRTEELAQLERRNWELRAEVAKCRANIEETNAILKRNKTRKNE